MTSEFVKRLIIITTVFTMSACMPPGVKEPEEDQDDSTSEPDPVVEELSQSPGRSIEKAFRQSWLNPDISPDGIGKVLVIAISDDEIQGSQYEIELTAALKAQGVDAVPRANILRLQGTPGLGRVEWFAKNDQFDHFMVTRLCPLEDNEKERAGGTEFELAGTLGQFGPFWEHSAQQPINPRESGKFPWLFVETSLFDSSKGTVVWRNRNPTSDPLFTESPAEFIGVLTSRLKTDGLIQ